MKILILGGFLGSGKTSVLMQLAKFLVERDDKDPSQTTVAIIENEIGNVGIDDKFMENGGFQVENLFSGCVCCSLTGEMVASVKKIKEHLHPQWLIIEATGVAYPGSIRNAILQGVGIDSYILTIVDASRWNRLFNAMENLVSGQLKDSSKVLLNKIDLVGRSEQKKCEESIRSFNSKIEIIPVTAKESIPKQLWHELASEMENLYEIYCS